MTEEASISLVIKDADNKDAFKITVDEERCVIDDSYQSVTISIIQTKILMRFLNNNIVLD